MKRILLVGFVVAILFACCVTIINANAETVRIEDTIESKNEPSETEVEKTIFDSFISNPIIVILGWIIGIISGAITIITNIRDRKAQGYLFEKAKLELKGNYTKEQIDELSLILKNMERQIKSDLPKLAKKIIRDKQKEEIATQLKSYYADYKRLDNIEEDENIVLDVEIQSAIEGELINKLSDTNNRTRTILQYVMSGISIVVLINIAPYFDYYIYRVIGIDNILNSFFSRFNPYQVTLYIFTLKIISISVNKLRINFLSKYNRILGHSAFKNAMYIIWLIMLFEVYFEPIPLGEVLCVIGAMVTLIPFTFARISLRKATAAVFI